MSEKEEMMKVAEFMVTSTFDIVMQAIEYKDVDIRDVEQHVDSIANYIREIMTKEFVEFIKILQKADKQGIFDDVYKVVIKHYCMKWAHYVLKHYQFVDVNLN